MKETPDNKTDLRSMNSVLDDAAASWGMRHSALLLLGLVRSPFPILPLALLLGVGARMMWQAIFKSTTRFCIAEGQNGSGPNF